MGFDLTARDRARLKGVNPDIIRIVERAAATSGLDFTVLEGMRTITRQKQLVAKGASKTMNSRHLTGHAVDIAPLINGKISWDWPLYHKLAPVVKKAAADLEIPLEWGGDWKSFKDGPHWQLPFAAYPKKQKFGMLVDASEQYTNESETASNMKGASAIGIGGATGAAATLGEVADTLVYQQSELSSGDWLRIAIAAAIVAVSIYAIWKQVK